MASRPVNLPPGFVLEQPSHPAPPASVGANLPPGFVLEQPQAQSAQAPEQPWYEKAWETIKGAATTEKIPWSPLYLGAEMGNRFGNKAQAIADEQIKQGNPIRAGIMASVADANKAVGGLLGGANSPVGMALSASPAGGPVVGRIAATAGAVMGASQMGGQQEGETTPDTVRRNLYGASAVVGALPAAREITGKITRTKNPNPQPSTLDSALVGNQGSVMPQAAKMHPKAVLGAEDVFRASAPTGMNKGFRGNVYAAAGDLAEIGQKLDLSEARGGVINPDMRVRATVEAIRNHLDEMYSQERAPQIERQANFRVKVSTNQNSQRGLEYLEATAGDVSDAKLATKAIKGKRLTVAEADRLAKVANQTLKAFERMTPEGKMQAQMTNPKISGLKALDSELSRNLNDVLRENGEPGLYSYERRFAALSAIRDALEARMNAVELQRQGLGKYVRMLKGGKEGITSASQAAVADVNIGRMLQRGLKRLGESGIKPDRPTAPTGISVRSTAPLRQSAEQ